MYNSQLNLCKWTCWKLNCGDNSEVVCFDSIQIDYPVFEKNFYIEHDEIAKLTEREVQDLRRKLGMKVLVLTVYVWHIY